jgi:hypothetical protein
VCAVILPRWKKLWAISSSFKGIMKGQKFTSQKLSDLLVSSKNMRPIIRFRNVVHHEAADYVMVFPRSQVD